MNTASQMLLYYSILYTNVANDSTSVNNGPINATPELIITLIISIILLFIIFHFIHRKIDREFKEMREYNKNNKDGCRITWE